MQRNTALCISEKIICLQSHFDREVDKTGQICNWTAYTRIKIHVFLCFVVCVVLSVSVVDVSLHLLLPQEKSSLRKTYFPWIAAGSFVLR